MTHGTSFQHQVGRRVAHARRAAGYTQHALAARLGWSRDTLASVESGRRDITLDRLAQLAQVLAVAPAALLVDDTAVASIIGRLIDEPGLVPSVVFFLDTVRNELPSLALDDHLETRTDATGLMDAGY